MQYSYDSRGRLISVAAPQGTTEITYMGAASLQRSIRDPHAGKTEYEYYLTPGEASFGKLKTEIRGGYKTTFEYNAGFGRLSKKTVETENGASLHETTIYAYDETDTPFGNGKLTTLTYTSTPLGAGSQDGFTIQERYAYDARGEVVQTIRRISHETETLCADADAMPCLQIFGKQKDNIGRVTEMLYPDGTKTSVEYVDDYFSHVKTIQHPSTSGISVTYSDYTYDVAPHVGRVTYGNGVEHRYIYDQTTGLLNTMKIGTQGTQNFASLLDLQYEYDNSYNIKRITDNVVPDLSAVFDYDANKRIRSAALDSGVVRTYQFDHGSGAGSMGNIVQKDNRRLTYAAGKTVPASDELFDDTTQQWQPNETFTWSEDGNLLTKGPFIYTYDAGSMMSSAVEDLGGGQVATTRFYYDHTGQRFLKTYTRNAVTIKTWYLGDGIELREKYNPSTGSGQAQFEAYQATKYIYGIDDKKVASI
ncbi:MAG TPA: hypothetical protein PLY93_14520, partial [Turneriella sp.]|nr:hypothetical protein [Turneriella sp.]